MVELTIRLVFSLAVVLGLLMLLARFSAKRFRGGKDAMVEVLHRQSLSRGSTVTVVNVAGRVLVLGTTEQQVRVLTELDPMSVLDEDDLLGDDGPAEVLTLVPAPSQTPPAEPAADASSAAPVTDAATDAATDRPSWLPSPAAGSALAGSVLSVDTWRQALAAATRREL